MKKINEVANVVKVNVNGREVEMKNELFGIEALVELGLVKLNKLVDRIDSEGLLDVSVSCIVEDDGNKFYNFVVLPKGLYEIAEALDGQSDGYTWFTEASEIYSVDLGIRELFTASDEELNKRIELLLAAYKNSIYMHCDAEEDEDNVQTILWKIDEDNDLVYAVCEDIVLEFDEDMQLISTYFIDYKTYKLSDREDVDHYEYNYDDKLKCSEWKYIEVTDKKEVNMIKIYKVIG